MKILVCALASLFWFIATTSFGQGNELDDAKVSSSGVVKLIFAPSTNSECESGKILAEKDLTNNIPFLCVVGGIAPTVFMPTDSLFEQRFHVYYYEFGCSPADDLCMVAYNHRIFQNLLETYGISWTKTIRKDVVGFSAWQKARR